MTGICGLILAAGRGRRMGIPKAVLPVKGEPLALVQARLLKGARVEPTVIVVGYRHDEVRKQLSPWPDIAVNDDWSKGQFSSLQAGLAYLPEGPWVLVLPVDAFGLRLETVKRLIDSTDDRFDAVVPVCRGRRGHPVLLAPPFRRRLAALPPETSRLDHLLREASVTLVSVEDEAVRRNINRPEDLRSI